VPKFIEESIHCTCVKFAESSATLAGAVDALPVLLQAYMENNTSREKNNKYFFILLY
jgi:hypothetical protein